MKTTRRTVVVAITILGIAWAWHLFHSVPQEFRQPVISEPSVRDELSDLTATSQLAPIERVEGADAHGIGLLVTGLGGMPLPGSSIFLCNSDPDARTTPSRAIADTDSAGAATVEPPRGQDSIDLLIHKRGYRAATLRHAKDGDVYTIRLDPGYSLSVRTLASTGEPLARVYMALSRSFLLADQPSNLADVARSVPGPDERSAIYSGISDDRGRIVIEGLAPGDYMIQIDSPGRAVVAGIDKDIIHIPCSHLDIVLAEVYAAVIRLEGEEIASYRTSGWTYRSTAATETRLHDWMVGRVRASLERRFPDDIVFVRMPDEASLRRSSPPTVSGVFIKKRGEPEPFGCTTQPASSVVPKTIALGVGKEPAVGSLLVEVRDSVGQPCRIPLVFESQSKEEFLVSATAYAETEVPLGEYRVLPMDGICRLFWPETRVVVTDGRQTIGVALTNKLYRCHVALQGEDGCVIPLSAALISVETASGHRIPLRIVSNSRHAEFLLPYGRRRMSIRVFGYRHEVLPFEVLPLDQEGPQLLEFSMRR